MPRFLPPTSSQVASSRYVSLHERVQARAGLHVACVGCEVCQADYLVERKTFPCFAVEFVLKGRGRAVLNGRSFPLYPGVLYCYGPQTAHELRSDSNQPMVKYFVDFFGTDCRSLLAKGNLIPGQAVQTFEMENYRTLFEQLLADGSKMSRSRADICNTCLRLILLKTADAVHASSPRESSSAESFSRCREFIDQHFQRLHNLDDIARELHVRPAHLCRLFQQFNQPSPFQYLTHLKMNRAMELLMMSGLSVKSVALEIGYEDPYHFSRLFKRHFGRSPRHFVEQSWRELI